MKILLTCTTIEEFHRVETAHDSHYPLGLGYLHSYLESLNLGYDVKTRFLNNVSFEKGMKVLEEDLETFKPDIVGISMITHSRVGAYKLIGFIEKKYPNIKIVIGGIHVSVLYEQLSNKYRNVVCVIGEGEITFSELIEKLKNKESFNNISGIAFYDHSLKKVVVTSERKLIENLDILPFPRHDLFIYEGKTIAGLLTSRGCPYKCNFCVLDAASRRSVRCRSASNIADEIEMILADHPSINTIWIHDDAFMIIKERTIEFCNEVLRRGIKTNFICSARFRPISREVVMLMKSAGFGQVLFGLESGAPVVMKKMKKGLTQKNVRHAVKLFSETGIKATAFLIVGLPGEDPNTIAQTIDFVQELQSIYYLYYDDIGIAGIYPGTELATLAKEAKMKINGYGVFNDNYWLTDGPVPFYEVDHKFSQLSYWKEEIRNAISSDRLLLNTNNFLTQRKLIPSFIEYCWRFNIPSMTSMILNILKRNQVILEDFIKTSFLNNKSSNAIKVLCNEVEKEFLKSLLSRINLQEQKSFIIDYKEQLKKDIIVLERWHNVQEAEKSGVESPGNESSLAVVNKNGEIIETFFEDGLDDVRKRRAKLVVL
jgi:anaerobic magnesium-protoporphyrin IX monomethyl ester cyclase